VLKRGYHHGNLREALVEACLALIAEKGPTGFTLSEAAREAGVTPAAVYRHFEGRDDLAASPARLPPLRRQDAPILHLPASIRVITWRCLKAG